MGDIFENSKLKLLSIKKQVFAVKKTPVLDDKGKTADYFKFFCQLPNVTNGQIRLHVI